MEDFKPCVYMMTNKRNGTIYIGSTSNLARRAFEHREEILPGFTKKYDCKMLVLYEYFDVMEDARNREYKLKGANRRKKLSLIEQLNPEWRDLYDQLI